MSASIAPAETAPGPGPGLKSEAPPGPSAFSWRVFSLLNAFRFAIAGLLLVSFFAIRDPRIVGDLEPALAVSVLVAMLLFAVFEQPLLKRRWPNLLAQIYVQFTFDLVTVVFLLHASGGIVSGVGGLLVVSIGTLALLVPLDRALLLASLTTFTLLGEQALSSYRGITASTDYAATGILAAVIFVITGIVQLLRKQIVETEALAERRGVDLQNLVELNEFIIRHLRESIVVVDGENRIRLLNESAAGMLGTRDKADNRTLEDLAPTLAARLRRWRDGGEETTESSMVIETDSNATKLQPHFARLGDDRRGGVVIFLEDTSLIVERVQQTKLAALGRLSASIAHEIRNPLGALSHAGQLLAESDGLAPDDRRLTEIIRINSGRVSRIVDSVLALSKGDKTKPERIRLKAWARDFADEFTKTQELFEGAVALTSDSIELEIEMDRTHLHQVVWNLCDNAVKYASAAAGAIAVELRCGALENSGRPYLDVIDSGPGVPPDKIEQIFEPFYTAQPGGTGLGLYISRELCERNAASLRYQTRAEGGSTFRIVFSDPERWDKR
jgi:two-component system sensor histidine kinase PilS (NtrC family)